MKTWDIGVTALGIGANAQGKRDQIDIITQCENASELIQGLAMLEERALQSERIVRNKIIGRRRKRFDVVEKLVLQLSSFDYRFQFFPGDGFIIFRSKQVGSKSPGTIWDFGLSDSQGSNECPNVV